MARHEYALCTPHTAQLYQERYGKRETLAMPYFKSLEWCGLRLTTYPAGHCLGSAMLLAEDGDTSLLYTGDFKLGESATAEAAVLPKADILVIESTFGDPRYRLTPRAQAIDQLVTRVRETLRAGAVPVVQAYVLGKAQEVTKILTDHGIPVLQHAKVYAISRIYEACGVSLGRYSLFPGRCLPGHAVVVPPRMHRCASLGRGKFVTFGVSGWAMHPSTRYRLGVDHAIPLSDHADYDELFQAVEQVGASEIYCTHGPESFVDCLRRAGFNAYALSGVKQMTLF
jgi:Cft2 family RNA processing exonuclease